jgi:hypothetical protein
LRHSAFSVAASEYSYHWDHPAVTPALSYPTVDLPPPDAPELQITVETLCQFTIQMSFLKTVIKISTAMIQTKGSTTPIHKCHQHSRHIPRDPPAKKEYRIFTARFLG